MQPCAFGQCWRMKPEPIAGMAPLARRAALASRRFLAATFVDGPRGIETSSTVQLEHLGLAAPGRVRYDPSGWRDLRSILRAREVDRHDVFIDFGAGKGRVVLDAARRYPFRRVVGIELAEELAAQARANVEASRGRLRCRDVQIVTADVVDYVIPDDVTVAYLYNPFRGEIFQALVDKLIASVDRSPRRLRMIYRTPLEQARLTASGRFRVVRVVGDRPWAHRSVRHMYVLAPAES